MTRRRLLVSLILLIIAVSLAAGGWYLFVRPIQVEVLDVQRDIPVQVFGLGTVESRITSKVGFKVAGVLTDLLADQGDCVAKGAVLARLDAREQEARVSRAKANVEQAKANLDRTLAAVAKAEASYANA